ncbi:MAG: hypothetical protein EHM24_09565, partial [Acidobacteria bacterium]
MALPDVPQADYDQFQAGLFNERNQQRISDLDLTSGFLQGTGRRIASLGFEPTERIEAANPSSPIFRGPGGLPVPQPVPWPQLPQLPQLPGQQQPAPGAVAPPPPAPPLPGQPPMGRPPPPPPPPPQAAPAQPVAPARPTRPAGGVIPEVPGVPEVPEVPGMTQPSAQPRRSAFAPTSGALPRQPTFADDQREVRSATATTAGISGGGDVSGRVGERGQWIMSEAANAASW